MPPKSKKVLQGKRNKKKVENYDDRDEDGSGYKPVFYQENPNQNFKNR